MRYPKPLSIFQGTEDIFVKARLTVLVVAAAVLVTGCSSAGGPGGLTAFQGPEFMQGALPDTDENGILLGRGNGASTQLRIARGLARTAAIAEIAAGMNILVDGWVQNLDEQEGTADPEVVQGFRAATELVFSEELMGLQERDSEIYERGDQPVIYVVFVLMELDPGAAAAAVVQRLAAEEAAYARFRMTETFEDMDEVIKNYEARRRNR